MGGGGTAVFEKKKKILRSSASAFTIRLVQLEAGRTTLCEGNAYPLLAWVYNSGGLAHVLADRDSKKPI